MTSQNGISSSPAPGPPVIPSHPSSRKITHRARGKSRHHRSSRMELASRMMHSTDVSVLSSLVQTAAASCEDHSQRSRIEERIPAFMVAMMEEGLVGDALVALDVENEDDMERLEVVLARANLPAVFFADFKLILSIVSMYSAIYSWPSTREDILGGAGGSTSPTSTLEQRLDATDSSIMGAYGDNCLSKEWQDLVRHRGGEHVVVKDFEQVSKEVVNNPESLLIWLAKYFGIIDDPNKFLALSVAYFNVSGGPTVEIETDTYGGLHFLHGTHMRSYQFVEKMLKHPNSMAAGVKCSKARAKSMSLVAFLTCGPSIWRRICRNVRATATCSLHVSPAHMCLLLCLCALHRHAK